MLLASECSTNLLEGNICRYTDTHILIHTHTYTNTYVELNLCDVLFLLYGNNSFLEVTMFLLALPYKKLPPYCTKTHTSPPHLSK